MKLKRFLAIIALLLCASMLFVSCKKDEEPEPEPVEEPLKLSDIFNMDWKKPEPETPIATQKAELKLNMAGSNSVDNLIIYTDANDYNITRVYDYVAQKELIALTDSITSQDNVNVTLAGNTDSFPATVYTHVNHYVYAPSGKNLVVLTVTHKSLTEYVEDYETVYVDYFDTDIYDYSYDSTVEEFSATYDLKIYNTADLSAPTKTISSNAVKSWFNTGMFEDLFYKNVVKDLTLHLDSLSSWYTISDDLILTKGKIYRSDDDRNLTFVRDVEMSKIEHNYTKGEKYYYYFDDNSITVYDALLNPVSSYDVPSYVDDIVYFFVLNDGNVLAQYKVEEDEDGDVYDFIDVYDGLNYKYSLYTYIISAADGTATEIDVDYLIEHLDSAYSANSDYTEYYNSEISNIAEIYYIVDSKLEDASTDLDIVSLDNNGNVVESLKMYDDWCSIPRNLGNGYFSARTVHGTDMIMDKDGNIISNSLYINHGDPSYNYLCDYTIASNGIYDATGKNVYNWTDIPHDTQFIDYDRNIILIKILSNDGTYKLDLFNNGTVTTIGNMDATGGAIDTTDMITDYYTTSLGFCTVSKDKDGNDVYKYYNASGALLATTEDRLYYIASFEGVYVYEGTARTEEGTQTVYYRFS